jgi:hypothetical protein
MAERERREDGVGALEAVSAAGLGLGHDGGSWMPGGYD